MSRFIVGNLYSPKVGALVRALFNLDRAGVVLTAKETDVDTFWVLWDDGTLHEEMSGWVVPFAKSVPITFGTIPCAKVMHEKQECSQEAPEIIPAP